MNSQTPDGPRGPGQEPGQSVVDDAAVRLAELLMIKPRWRGWIHTVTAPLALAAGIILVVVAPTEDRKVSSAIYAATGVLLFGISAVYHRGNW
jgi:hemolysin III